MPHRPPLPFANVSHLPQELVSIVLGFLFDSGVGYKSGPGGILDDASPSRSDRRFFARTVARINRTFNEVATEMLWRSVVVESVSELRYLGLATRDNWSLGSMTRRLHISIEDPVDMALLDQLLQRMQGLKTIVYGVTSEDGVEQTHSDAIIDSLSSFCPAVRCAVFMTHHEFSPSPAGLCHFLHTQKKLEVLHVDDVCPKLATVHDNCDQWAPSIPPGFKAKSLRVLSLGDWDDDDRDWDDDGQDWDDDGKTISEFLGQFSRGAFPRLEKMCCVAFTPGLPQFLSRQSDTIRHLQITTPCIYAYVDPAKQVDTNILDILPKIVRLTWRISIPYGMSTETLRAWQPLPRSHGTLSRVTIVPDAYADRHRPQLGRALKRMLTAIVEGDFPSLRLVEIEDTIAKRDDIEGSGWFSRLVRNLKSTGEGVVVEILDTGISDFPCLLIAPRYSGDVST